MEQKHPIIDPEKIHLQQIDNVQQKIDVQLFKKGKQHHLKTGYKVLHNLKEERVKIEVVFSFEGESNMQAFFFQFDFHFMIEDLSKFYELNENEHPVFQAQLIATLLGISLSTARGIIFEKSQNAGLKNVIIPVVSPQRMLANPSSK